MIAVAEELDCRTRVRSLPAGLLALALLAGAPSPAAPGEPIASLEIAGGKVVTVTRGVLEGGTVITRGTRIEKVLPAPSDGPPEGRAGGPTDRGAECPEEESPRRIDARDLWVLPGFVDLHSHIGGSDLNDMVYPTNSGFRVLDNIMPENPLLQRAQAGGVTTILFLPGSGTNLSGFAALMKTGGETLEDALVRFPAALKVSQGGNPERRGGDLGLGPMGMNALLREALQEGKRYVELWDAYKAGETTDPPPFNPRLEHFRKVFRKEIPVLVHTQGYLLVEQTVRLLRDELDLRVIIGHGTFDGSELAPEVARKGIRVTNGPRQLRFDRERGSIVGLARRWHDGGVDEICINTDAGVVPQEELSYQAAMAVRLGLDEEVALRAITIHGARALGLEDRIGSLEEGKDADVVLWSGNPLHPASRVVVTICNGRIVYDARREPRRF